MNVVFHLNESNRLNIVLSNIRNILKMDDVSVVLLINGEAINLFKNIAFEIDINSEWLKVMVCKNSMVSNNVLESDLPIGIEIVPSGVYTLTYMQVKLGYAYIKA